MIERTLNYASGRIKVDRSEVSTEVYTDCFGHGAFVGVTLHSEGFLYGLTRLLLLDFLSECYD